MTGGINSGYQLLQPIIADADEDGVADSAGFWRSGDTFYDMLCRYERSDTVDLNNPAEWIKYVLEDFGINSEDIDTTSFSAAETTYDTLNIEFSGGGWWKKESKESVLSNLLAQTDSFLKCTDKVELYQFNATSVETITDVLLLSFSPSRVTKSTNDSGRVCWPEAIDKPSDVLNGKAVVPTHNNGTENIPSSDILECKFLPGQSINAQKAGILYFQKKYEQSQKINFSITFSNLITKTSLAPGQVVTVDNTLYGGTNNVIITDMTINPDMKVDFTGVVLNYLEDWGDLTTTTKDVVTDSSSGFQIATTDYSGTLSENVNWETNLLNIPDRFKDTASLGINVTDSYMGYYDGSVFQSYIDNNGNFQFRGDDDNYINWNGIGLNIKGTLTITGGSGIGNLTDAGNLATRDTIDTSYLTDAGALATLDSIDTSYVIDAGDLATVNADALVYFSTTAPIDPASNPLWGDTSVTPYKLKRWNGTGWDIIATLNTGALADVDAADWSTQITGTGKPADNADVTQTELNLGAAIDNATANGTTLISGGYIQTSLLDVDDIIVNGSIIVTGDGTSLLNDDAGLGSTAVWANVSGTGKPADNADVTDYTSIYNYTDKKSALKDATYGFEDGKTSIVTAPNGWHFEGSGSLGSYFENTDADSLFESVLSYGSTQYTNPNNSTPMGYWKISKFFELQDDSGTLNISATGLCLSSDIPQEIIDDTFDSATQTCIGEDDLFIQVQCFKADGTEISLSLSDEFTRSWGHLIYDNTGYTSIRNIWFRHTHTISIPANTKIVKISLCASDCNDEIVSLGTFNANAAGLWDDFSIQYDKGFIETSSTWAAAIGADVTADNTANDASNLGGVPSSVIANWRYGETTYINGGDIYTGTVTANKLNFTPVDSSNIVGTINASSEGIDITGSKISLNGDTNVAGTFTITAADNISDVESGADNTTTTINGGIITTGYIRDSSSNMVIDFNDSSITINSEHGLIVNSSNGIKIDSSGSIVFMGKDYSPGILVFTGSLSSSVAGTDATGDYLCFWPTLSEEATGFGVGYRPTFDGNIESTPYTHIYLKATDTVGLVTGDSYINILQYGILFEGDITPNLDNTYSLGSSIRTLKNVYANTYYGDGSNLTGLLTYSAGDGLDLTGSTFSLESSPSVSTLYVSSKIYHEGDTDTNIYFTTDKIEFTVGDKVILTLEESTIDKVSLGSHVEPSMDSIFNFGSPSYAWKSVYGDAIYRNGTALDVYDDLYELSKIKSKKQKNKSEEKLNNKNLPIIDPLTLPREMTNYDDIVEKLKHDNCDLITQEDIDEYIQDDEEAGWLLKTDFTLLSDLTMGAVRQLDQDVISMFNLLAARITELEVQLKK
jgi:hypothetical protein